MGIYVATVSTDGSGDGTNLDALGLTKWNGIFRGLLTAVKFDYSASTDAGADTTLTEISGLQRTLITKSNSATDFTAYPRIQATDSGGTAIAGAYEFARVDSANLKVTIAQGGATVTDAIRVIVDILED